MNEPILLSDDDLEVAAKCAEKYPPGYGDFFLSLSPDNDEIIELFANIGPHLEVLEINAALMTPDSIALILQMKPELTECGCPTIAIVSSHRREGIKASDGKFIQAVFAAMVARMAFTDGQDHTDFCNMLDLNPQEIARKLRAAKGKPCQNPESAPTQ